MRKRVFAPGCALMLYKPVLAEKLHLVLKKHFGDVEMHSVCCHKDPCFKEPTEIINICPGCDKRFRNDYKNCSTISLWEVLSGVDLISYPDYDGKSMSILDACPTREQDTIHTAIRKVIQRMNIKLVEPEKTRAKSVCCGDSFYGQISTEKVIEQMRKRASDMPADDVVVYCVSCIKSMYNGNKTPRYLIDLLFGEETLPQTIDPDEWHRELEVYMENH